MPPSKLSPAQARDIYERAHNGERQKRIAQDYGIPVHVISDIKRGFSHYYYTGARTTASIEELADGHDFAPIPNFDGFWITDDGRVIFERAGTYCLSKYAGVSRQGYLMAYVDYQKLPVHRLLCLAFKYESYFEGAVARHLNDIRDDNRLENLEWGTHAQNAEDRIRNGRSVRGERHPHAKLTRAKVRKIRELGKSDLTQREISVRFGITASTVGAIINRRSWGWFD